MHFTTLVASVTALAMSVSAVPSPATPANTRYVQLRLYGEPGCSAQNLGELGVYGDYVNSCQSFGDNDVKSVSFEYAINNCTGMFLHSVTSFCYNADSKQCLFTPVILVMLVDRLLR